MQAEPDDLRYEAGAFTVADSGRSITLREIAQAALDGPAEAPAAPLAAGFDAEETPFSLSLGIHVCELLVDPETGAVEIRRYCAVDDFGQVIDEQLCAGQVQGGVAQGIGQALLEQVVHDPESGQLLTGSLMDYGLPRADLLPAIETACLAGPPFAAGVLGAKGAGEAGTVAAPPAVMNALMDALAPLGVTQLDMPATPERVWRAIAACRDA